jgi:hypothetical protein
LVLALGHKLHDGLVLFADFAGVLNAAGLGRSSDFTLLFFLSWLVVALDLAARSPSISTCYLKIGTKLTHAAFEDRK